VRRWALAFHFSCWPFASKPDVIECLHFLPLRDYCTKMSECSNSQLFSKNNWQHFIDRFVSSQLLWKILGFTLVPWHTMAWQDMWTGSYVLDVSNRRGYHVSIGGLIAGVPPTLSHASFLFIFTWYLWNLQSHSNHKWSYWTTFFYPFYEANHHKTCKTDIENLLFVAPYL